MKYNQPFDQPSNPNAPYVDGNPGAGISGSIPPAASIEYPQREIVAVISAVGSTPSNADLTQLLKALQIVDVCNFFKLSTNTGTASAWVGTIPALPIMPPPRGTMVWFQPGFVSVSGGTTFTLNGVSAPVTLADHTALAFGDVSATAWLLLFFDGVEWLTLAGLARPPGALPRLQANADWYVNAGTGSDTAFDGTSATVSGTHGPFATMQKAASTILLYDMNGYNQNIHVADGSYLGPVFFSTPNGAGAINVLGNHATPANCSVTVSGSLANAIQFLGGVYFIDGFRPSTGSIGGWGIGVDGGNITIGNMQFGQCGESHMTVRNSGSTMNLNAGAAFTIEGGANVGVAHIWCAASAALNVPNPPGPAGYPTLSILGAVNLPQFVEASDLGFVHLIYQSITGAGFATGKKFDATMNGVIDTFSGGTGAWPGTLAGTTSNGGQCV